MSARYTLRVDEYMHMMCAACAHSCPCKNAQDEVMQQALDEFLQEVQSEKPDASTDSALVSK